MAGSGFAIEEKCGWWEDWAVVVVGVGVWTAVGGERGAAPGTQALELVVSARNGVSPLTLSPPVRPRLVRDGTCLCIQPLHASFYRMSFYESRKSRGLLRALSLRPHTSPSPMRTDARHA